MTSTTDRVRAICLAFLEATERPSHGSPAFFVRKQFVMLWPDGHHDHRFAHMWCAAPPGVQQELVETERGLGAIAGIEVVQGCTLVMLRTGQF